MPEKRKSAFIRATQEAQERAAHQPETPLPTATDDTVAPSHRAPAATKAAGSTTERKTKISFYLSPEQEEKLGDLEVALWTRYKRRINRNDIVRYLIDHCDIDSLEALATEET